MEISQIIPHVEALIFAADRPLPLLEIVDLLNNALAFLEDRTNLDQVEAAMEAIREKYSSEFYAFEVRSSGGGYQFLTKKDYYQTVAQLNGDKFLKRLSTAALETLAIIAYRQPISKGEIEYIRGVSTDYSIQKLLEKELIVITGRSEDQPGKPLLYAVSRSFMDYFGISSVADLPKLKELFDEEMVQPTLINDDTATLERGEHSTHTETAHSLMVSEDGELLDPDHQLDHLAPPSTDTEEEPSASEDEEVEPDDEIIRFDDIIEEANEESGEDSETGLAEAEEEKEEKSEEEKDEEDDDDDDEEDEEEEEDDDDEDESEEDEDPYAVRDSASPANEEENEDPDGIVEDVISGEEETEVEEEEADEDDEEDDDEKGEDDDSDEEPDSTMEDAILGEKLLEISGPGIEYNDEEEDEDEDDDDDDYDDEDEDDEDDDNEEDEDDDDDEKDENSGK